MNIVNVTPQNVFQETVFCVKNIKNPGFKRKVQWFEECFNKGLRIKILKNDNDKALAFIEYTPSEFAWRPVQADNFMFVHCMFTYSNKDKKNGYGSLLLSDCEQTALSHKMKGVCAMTSDGSWMTDRRLFEKNEYKQVDRRGRFELMSKTFSKDSVQPKLIDWTIELPKFKGWNLVYSDQCPWHEKSVKDLIKTAGDFGISLKTIKLNTSDQAKKAPSGFGTFSLIHNGRLIEDHYISATRFRNILKKERVE